jgi:hypothetical protein
MNRSERQMVDLLLDLKANHAVIGLKMEFEAEGIRPDMAMRFKEIAMAAGLPITTKIGGCEAFTDIYMAASLGTAYLLAPMVESPFALQKFIRAASRALPEDLRSEMELYINIETITACQNFAAMLAVPEAAELDGIDIGRHDLLGSMGLGNEAYQSPEVVALCENVIRLAKGAGKKVIIGGGVGTEAMPFFNSLPSGHLDKYETAKVVFGCPAALNNTEEAFNKAGLFELMWFKCKQAYYGAISTEDAGRLRGMEQRHGASLAGYSK